MTGTTADVSPYKDGSDPGGEKPATLRLNFDHIQDTHGQSKQISSVLTGVENAREQVDASSGLITGIKVSGTYAGQIDQGLDKLGGRHSELAQLLGGVRDAFLKKVDASIDYKPGADVQLKLTKNLDWTPNPGTIPAPGPISPAPELETLVNSLPFRTVALKPPDPSDMTNLMFLGTAEQVTKHSEPPAGSQRMLSVRTPKWKPRRAIIEDRGYSEAPMSILTLEGRPPDLALQKQNNTFAMRHHIRIWQRPQQFNGKTVWVAAATHDISITFSQTSKSFTHGIDPHIDAERAKVANDWFLRAQCMDWPWWTGTTYPKMPRTQPATSSSRTVRWPCWSFRGKDLRNRLETPEERARIKDAPGRSAPVPIPGIVHFAVCGGAHHLEPDCT